MFAPLMLGTFLYGGLTLDEDPRFTRFDFFLCWLAAVSFYFVIIFLPVLIRTVRKIR
jgi:hypothetical protein